MKNINGFELYDFFSAGANRIISKEETLNSINVYPIADGDTGSNLAYTMKGILTNGKRMEHAGKTLDSLSNAALLDSYGNSGTIFASYLMGISSEVNHMSIITIEDFSKAALTGADYAYNSIAKPTEGTILTIMKEWAHFLCRNHSQHTNIANLFTDAIIYTKTKLDNTKDQLKALNDADVVDAGALGFVYFLEGMLDSIISGVSNIMGNYDSKHLAISHDSPTKRYCVEMTLEPTVSFDKSRLIDELSYDNDSIILQKSNKYYKLHLHSDHPNKVANSIVKNSKIIRSKVDDMGFQVDMKNKMHPNIGIITDSIADLPNEISNSNFIHVIPLTLIANGNIYNDRLSISNDTLFDIIESGHVKVSSAQPSDVLVEKSLRMMCDNFEYVIGIFVSSQMSGIYDKVTTISKKLNLDNLTIFDSKLNSAAEGLLIKSLYDKIISGYSYKDIYFELEKTISKIKIFVEIKDLYYATKCGRIPKLIGSIATALKLNAVISIDQNGKGIIVGERSIVKCAKKLTRKSNISKYSVVYTGNLNDQIEHIEHLKLIFGSEPEFIEEASSIISAFVGKNAIGIAILEV